MTFNFAILSWLLWGPMIGAVVIATLDRHNRIGIRSVAFLSSAAVWLVSLPLAWVFRPELPGLQFVVRIPWINSLGIHYGLGLDGISILLVLLTTFLSPLVILSTFSQIETRLKEFYIAFLMLETGMLGVFMATDLFLFYVFWEAMLLPMVLLIGVWGGRRRIFAAVKFFLFTMVGSLVMLLAVLYVYKLAGTFEIAQIPAALVKAGLSAREELLLFGAFALSFAIKVPMFPFHTWLPDAHVEAPTSGSVMLAGVLLKMGTYGFIRFCLPLFPSASQSMAPLFCALALVGIVYGAFLALAQSDLKKLVAYSSISHLGFVVLGIFASVLTTSAGQPSHLALSGSVIQMVAHGLTTGALFLLVGMIYERRHTREIGEYGGLANQVPVFCTMLLIVTLGSIGLPGLAGFVGEFLILLGTAEAHWLLAAVAVSGVVLGALYMLYMVHRVVWGKLTNPANEGLEDLTGMEKAYMLPILVMIFVLGLFPGVFVDQVEKSSEAVIKQVDVGAAKLREARERDLRRAKGRQR